MKDRGPTYGKVKGRPDFRDKRFGKTYLKTFPPYVYSLLGGMLVHKTLRVEANWYAPHFGDMERLASPRLVFETVCGMNFYGGIGDRAKRSQACKVPALNAVLCGRCHGTGPTFGRGLAELKVTRYEARKRIGCVVEVENTENTKGDHE